MKKQQICFIFLFFVCVLMSSVAKADLSIDVINSPGPVYKEGYKPYFLVEVQVDEIPTQGHTVTFSINPNDGNVSFAYGGSTDVTGSNGRAGATLNVGDKASGTYTITASSGTVSVSRTVTVGTVPSLSVSVSSSASNAAPGDTVTFTATVTENNNPASGQALTFGVNRYTGTSTDIEFIPVAGTASLSSTSATTDSNGKASTSLTIGSGASGSYSVSATLSDGRLGVASVTVEGSSSPPPTDPNPDPPESPPTDPNPDPLPEVVQIPEEQQAAPEGSTGNTQTQQTGPQSSTGNTSPASTGPMGNTQGTPPSVLVVSIPVISKTVLDSGESFTISVTVENTSESLSPETILRYYRGSDIGMSGTEVGKRTVNPIAAMGTSDVSISLTAPDAPGTYLYYACISSVTGGSNTGNTCTPNSVQLTVRGESQDTSEPQGTSKYDVNGDGAVDIEDAALVAGAFGTNTAKYDVDGNGSVDIADLLLIIQNRQEAAGAPSVVGMKFTAAQIDRIQVQVGLLAATNDRSPAVMQTLAYLRSLIAVARPGKTHLLANYPNPFNPETWIPYRLAAAADVTLTIYDINGQVIRTLALGHQAAGMYQTRSCAAYWDGRNAFGEPVASGLYFYTLTAGDFTATRKMLIRK